MVQKHIIVSMFTSVAVAGILILTLFAATGNAQQPSMDTDTILSMHNSERTVVGVPALVWSDDLAAQAKTWAEHLAATGEFAHDPNKGDVGENIAGYFTGVAQGVQLWIDEKKDYHGDVLTPENWSPSGHYTQMVWRDTTQVGCGTAPPNGQPSPGGHAFSILVCRYTPPGNYMGQKPY